MGRGTRTFSGVPDLEEGLQNGPVASVQSGGHHGDPSSPPDGFAPGAASTPVTYATLPHRPTCERDVGPDGVGSGAAQISQLTLRALFCFIKPVCISNYRQDKRPRRATRAEQARRQKSSKKNKKKHIN